MTSRIGNRWHLHQAMCTRPDAIASAGCRRPTCRTAGTRACSSRSATACCSAPISFTVRRRRADHAGRCGRPLRPGDCGDASAPRADGLHAVHPADTAAAGRPGAPRAEDAGGHARVDVRGRLRGGASGDGRRDGTTPWRAACQQLTGSSAAVTVARVTGFGATSLDAFADGLLARAVAETTAGQAVEAETELYRRFAPRVRLYGLKHLRDRGAADDLAQQVMLIVIERLHAGEVRDPDQVASFILSTSRMVVVGLRRTAARREQLLGRFDSRREDAVSPDEGSIDAARIGSCLGAIGERERTIL